MSQRRLGFVLSTPPARHDLNLIVPLAQAAAAQGIRTELFVMSEAVGYLEQTRLKELDEAGCEIIACATSRYQHDSPLPEFVTEGSQDDHAALLARCQRVLAFT